MVKKIFIISIIFVLGIYILQGICPQKGGEKMFSVGKGQSLFQISQNLEKEGLVKNRFFFDICVFLKGGQKKLQAGEYQLNPSMGISEIAQKIISGDIAKIIVVIPEGFTVKQIEERVRLKLPGEDLEGFLFPDTYQFPAGVSGEGVVKEMRDNFDKKIAPYQDEIAKAGLTLSDVVKMASLLEKEIRTKEDKFLVSGILWKRLKNGIPLQVDATIAYLTGKKMVSQGDTKINSPYNTYKVKGLPFGPICNPGIDSIIAAIHPESSQFWFYLSTPDGKTIFSKTLEEHNLAKAKYLK